MSHTLEEPCLTLLKIHVPQSWRAMSHSLEDPCPTLLKSHVPNSWRSMSHSLEEPCLTLLKSHVPHSWWAMSHTLEDPCPTLLKSHVHTLEEPCPTLFDCIIWLDTGNNYKKAGSSSQPDIRCIPNSYQTFLQAVFCCWAMWDSTFR